VNILRASGNNLIILSMSDPNRLLTMMSNFVCLLADHENNKLLISLMCSWVMHQIQSYFSLHAYSQTTISATCSTPWEKLVIAWLRQRK
jgi:hypothetical protein